MSPLRIAALVIGSSVISVVGCAPTPIRTSAILQDWSAKLVTADTLVRAGCFTCLQTALGTYEMVGAASGVPSAVRTKAALGVARTAVLLDLRERELGTVDDHFLARARRALEQDPPLEPTMTTALELVEYVPWRIAEAGSATEDERLARSAEIAHARDTWRARYVEKAAESELDGYLWLAFACESGLARVISPEELAKPLGALTGAPLLAYKLAICPRIDTDALSTILEGDARFVEINYFLGVQTILRGKPWEAEPSLERAYDWRHSWPAVTLSLANAAIASADFDRALRFYDETLRLTPTQRAAVLGRIRSLSHLSRHAEAVTAASAVVESPWDHGDAYYWRAWNELRLGQIEQAWADVEAAQKLWVNADVAKLAGLIAYRRQQLDVARKEFEEGHRLGPDDCETIFNLGTVHADLHDWPETAQTFVTAAACLEDAQLRLRKDISSIQSSEESAERKSRKVATREQQIATAGRMLATSWFNTAVAYFNLSRTPEARLYAEKISADEQFGARARELLTRRQK